MSEFLLPTSLSLLTLLFLLYLFPKIITEDQIELSAKTTTILLLPHTQSSKVIHIDHSRYTSFAGALRTSVQAFIPTLHVQATSPLFEIDPFTRPGVRVTVKPAFPPFEATSPSPKNVMRIQTLHFG